MFESCSSYLMRWPEITGGYSGQDRDDCNRLHLLKITHAPAPARSNGSTRQVTRQLRQPAGPHLTPARLAWGATGTRRRR